MVKLNLLCKKKKKVKLGVKLVDIWHCLDKLLKNTHNLRGVENKKIREITLFLSDITRLLLTSILIVKATLWVYVDKNC